MTVMVEKVLLVPMLEKHRNLLESEVCGVRGSTRNPRVYGVIVKPKVRGCACIMVY